MNEVIVVYIRKNKRLKQTQYSQLNRELNSGHFDIKIIKIGSLFVKIISLKYY